SLASFANVSPDSGTATSEGGDELSGRYEMMEKDAGMTIEFKSDHKVHMTTQEPGGQPQGADGDYAIKGNKVTITVSGGNPFVLVRDGNTLAGEFEGRAL